MKKVSQISAVGLFSLVLAAGFLAYSAAPQPPVSIATSDPEIVALGARLFQKNCSPCHGKEAAGEDPAAPMGGWKTGVGHRAPALNGTGHAWHHPPEYFFRMIREGTDRPNSRMVGWAGRMSDFEILAVIAYFQTLWPRRIKEAYRDRYLHRAGG